jgi:hypothetical protein
MFVKKILEKIGIFSQCFPSNQQKGKKFTILSLQNERTLLEGVASLAKLKKNYYYFAM